jgi:NDP-sugar pyrophosphorylase family protein
MKINDTVGGLSEISVYVLAGGLGTRIRPVLGDLPKLLAPVKGEPFIEILFRWLQSFHAKHIVLGLGYQADAVLRYLDHSPHSGINIEFVVESEPLGTAGALRLARGKLQSDPVLVLNGDSLLDADLFEFLLFHKECGAIASLAATHVNDAGRFGRLELDGNWVTRFAEKDPACLGRNLINAGAYLFSAALLDEITLGEARSLETDVLAKMPKRTLAAFVYSGLFADFGTPESYRSLSAK